jgi:hypothetical protein
MTDISTVAAYREAMAVNGVAVTIQRVSGYAPNVTTLASVAVQAIVRNVTMDTTQTAQTGLSASSPGAIPQDDRLLIVLADDLAAANFPLPLAKGDLIVLALSAEQLQVTRVDPYKRALAGAIEITAAGVT